MTLLLKFIWKNFELNLFPTLFMAAILKDLIQVDKNLQKNMLMR